MNKEKIPAHVALIPDGNRRWAVSKGLIKTEGYKKINYKHLEDLFLEAKDLGVKYISIWIFSTENWKRSRMEVNFLFKHFLNNADDLLKGAKKHKVRIRHLGRKDRLPSKVIDVLRKLEEQTASFSDFNIQLCFDYGGRDEIIRAVNKIIQEGMKEINEEEFSKFLDTKDVPDVDLIIRTSNEQRTSGLMPFQSTYAELYFTDVHFPDFDAGELRKAIEEYKNRQRRFGGS